MTRPLQVSEKTLELNIASELLELARRRNRRSYLVGMTQAQEQATGVDVGLTSLGRLYAAIQFKAPWAATPVAVTAKTYTFTLGGRQLAALQDLAALIGPRVLYALPCMNTAAEVAGAAPDLCRRTHVLDPTSLSRGTHRVLVDSRNIRVYSDAVAFEHRPIRDAIGPVFDAPFESGDFLAGRLLLDWVNGLADLTAGERGQLLRGLVVLGAPAARPG
jgi:hypothetical protein